MALACAFLILSLASCSRQPAAEAGSLTYEVRGIVRAAPDTSTGNVLVEHEDIPGFMPSMTMPFRFRDVHELGGVVANDAVAFTLVVAKNDSWIIGVRKIDAATVKLPAKAPQPSLGKIERVKVGDPMPDFNLVDQNERPIKRETFAGKSLLLTFIFTRCAIPNFCPLMAQNFRSMHETIRADATLNGKVSLLSISFDEQDSPALLAEYGRKFTDDLDTWRFATGKPEEVQKLTRALSVQVQPEGGTINHGLATALVGPDGFIRHIWRGNGWSTDEVIAALRQAP